MLKKIVLIFLAFFFTVGIAAQAAVLDSYLQDFNNFADNASINGKDYWIVSGGLLGDSIAQSRTTPSGAGISVRLTGSLVTSIVERPFSYGGLSPTWIRFKIYPALAAQTPSVPSGGIAAICFDYTGQVLATNGASWLDTGQSYSLNQWYDVALKLNFSNHTYDLYLSPVNVPNVDFSPIKSGLKFIDSSKNSLSDIKFHGAYSTSGSSNVYIDDVSIIYIDRLEIISAAQKLMQGQISSPITLQLQDANSSPQTAVSNITLELKSTSSKGEFSVNREPWTQINQIILPALSQDVTFYYKDTGVGKPIITVSEYPEMGFTDALQELEIINKVSRFDIEVASEQIAGASFKLKLTARDENGNVNELYNGSVKLSVNYVSPLGGSFSVVPDTVTGFIKGVAETNLTYADCGLITITATDSEDPELVGTSTQVLFLPASFTVSAAATQIVSRPFTLSITAKNIQGQTTPNYNSDVNLYPVAVAPVDISKAVLSPVKAAGAAFINGIANVDTSYNLYGTIKVRAEDSADTSKAGLSDAVAFAPKQVTISITPPVSSRDFFYINEPFEAVVKVVDEAGVPIVNYPGSVELTSGAGITLPVPYTFTDIDAGKHNFSVNSTQEGSYTIISRLAQDNLSAESAKITVKNATIQVLDTTSPVGTGEITIQILDDKGKIITTENNLTINVKAVEEVGNSSVSLPASTVTFKEGRATIPVTDIEPEIVTIVPTSAYKINIKSGSITFGRAGKTGINQLMWREIKTK